MRASRPRALFLIHVYKVVIRHPDPLYFDQIGHGPDFHGEWSRIATTATCRFGYLSGIQKCRSLFIG